MWKITKQFEFCYSHRVWKQELNIDFSLDSYCACRANHGHQSTITITLEGETLNKQSMICDFKNLNFMKKFIDDELDHKFIIDINDPYTPHLIRSVIPENEKYKFLLNPRKFCDSEIYHSLEKPINNTSYQNEVLEGIVFVDFVPTSECLAQWLHKICDLKMSKLGIKTTSVKFSETPKTSAEYYG